jgi:hypothetical protein
MLSTPPRCTQRGEVYQMMGACLNIGNCQMKAEKDGSVVKNTDQLELCAKVLRVPAEALGKALTTKTVKVMTELMAKPLEPKQAPTRRRRCSQLPPLRPPPPVSPAGGGRALLARADYVLAVLRLVRRHDQRLHLSGGRRLLHRCVLRG